MENNFLGIPVAAYVIGGLTAALVFVFNTSFVLLSLNDVHKELGKVSNEKQKVQVVEVIKLATPSATVAPTAAVKVAPRAVITITPTIKR